MRRVHFIGVGGFGMSAVAEVLHLSGWVVTGSDARESTRTRRLRQLGVPVRIGQAAENLGQAELAVYSTDVPDDHLELQAARARGIPVRHRSEMLAELLNPRYGIAVTGTHGKTTTTSIIATVLVRSGLDPTVLLGGELPAFGGTARLGSGPYVVAEADESDGSFLRYRPRVAVVTNVEREHLEKWGNDFGRLIDGFERFVGQVQPDGLAVLCGDDPHLRGIAERAAVPVLRYGFGPGCDLRGERLRREPGGGWSCDVWHRGDALGRLLVPLPGRHNVGNALGALAAALHVGVTFAQAAAAIEGFANARRRFEVVGTAGGVRVVDDYAHHPTEIRATLAAAREGLERGGRLLAVFQPQRYTRTHLLLEEFAEAFGDADLLLLTEIYSPPGERPIPGVSAAALADRIAARTGGRPELWADQRQIVERLAGEARPGDTVLTMGAGDVWRVAAELAARFAAAAPPASHS